jgi:hypothetical protein
LILVKFEENVQESCNYPLKYKDKNNNGPIKPIRAWITQNIWLISDSSTIEEIENLHQYKGSKDKSEMS